MAKLYKAMKKKKSENMPEVMKIMNEISGKGELKAMWTKFLKNIE